MRNLIKKSDICIARLIFKKETFLQMLSLFINADIMFLGGNTNFFIKIYQTIKNTA